MEFELHWFAVAQWTECFTGDRDGRRMSRFVVGPVVGGRRKRVKERVRLRFRRVGGRGNGGGPGSVVAESGSVDVVGGLVENRKWDWDRSDYRYVLCFDKKVLRLT